jgi:hypothetical protein
MIPTGKNSNVIADLKYSRIVFLSLDYSQNPLSEIHGLTP